VRIETAGVKRRTVRKRVREWAGNENQAHFPQKTYLCVVEVHKENTRIFNTSKCV